VIKLLGYLLMVVGLSGCGQQIALLYSNTVAPYSNEFDAAKVGSKSFTIIDTQFREPVSGYSLSAEWTTSQLMEEAHKAGMRKINYIDRRTLKVLLGIYRRDALIVYGD